MYVLFQDSLYKAIEKSSKIIPFGLPIQKRKILGYADDTNVCICNDEGFLETFKIISMFETATNSKLNI